MGQWGRIWRLGCGSTNVIVKSSHTEIFFETSQTGVSDVCSVEEREKIEQREEGQENPIHFPDQLRGGFLVPADVLVVRRARLDKVDVLFILAVHRVGIADGDFDFLSGAHVGCSVGGVKIEK